MKIVRHVALILFANLLLHSASGQTSTAEALAALKEGALVVKLIIPEKKIEMLLKQNKKEEAIKVEEEAAALNQQLIAAFSAAYTFGPLYFVYTPDLHFLAEGDPGAMFDKNGAFATAFPKNWLFIELGESHEQSVDGFVVTDRNSDIVPKPFPNFISHWDAFHLNTKPLATMVNEWQKKLKKLEKRL